MSSVQHSQDYQFVLPELKAGAFWFGEEVINYFPYRLEDAVTPESIRQELARQKHMIPLLERLDAKRRVYLLTGDNWDILYLAAQYIGTYHRLVNADDVCYTHKLIDDMEEGWDKAEYDEILKDLESCASSFNYSAWLPCLDLKDTVNFCIAGQPFNFFAGMQYLHNSETKQAPWWITFQECPLVLRASNSGQPWCGHPSVLPQLMPHLTDHAPLIILAHFSTIREENRSLFDDYEQPMDLDNIAFELETKVIHLETPEATGDYYQKVLCQLIGRRDMALSAETKPAAVLQLIQERRQEVSNTVIEKSLTNTVLRKQGNGPLTMEDFGRIPSKSGRDCSFKREKKESPSNMVGQLAVRQQLEQIVNCMDFQHRRRKMGLPGDDIHYTFAFLGAPGTGKTTWAKWLGQEMVKRGLLDNCETICINAAELKALYVGHTTAKVKRIFEEYGVILLDEAYSLTEDRDGDGFGKEALSQLCVELENHASDRLVIFAGYGGSDNPGDNRMLKFLQSNPGLNSRISFKIHFQNFQPAELVEVTRTMLAKDGYQLLEETDEKIEAYFRSRMKERAFGNCREARNLADRIKIRLAARLCTEKDWDREQACRILPEDVTVALKELEREYKGLAQNEPRPIGFSGEKETT